MTLSFFLWIVSIYFVFVMFWLIGVLANGLKESTLAAFVVGAVMTVMMFFTVWGLPSPLYGSLLDRMVAYFQDVLGFDTRQEVLFARELEDGNVLVVMRRGKEGIPRMYVMNMSKKEKSSLANAMGQKGQHGNAGKVIVEQGENAYGKRFIYVRSRKEMIRK